MNRSRLPRGLRRGSAAVHLLGLRFRIPLCAWMSTVVSIVCCQVEVSVPGWSLVQRSNNGVCLCSCVRVCPWVSSDAPITPTPAKSKQKSSDLRKKERNKNHITGSVNVDPVTVYTTVLYSSRKNWNPFHLFAFTNWKTVCWVAVCICQSPIFQSFFNLLKPTVYVTYQQFNIQQLYVLPTLYLCVLYLSGNKQRLVPLTA